MIKKFRTIYGFVEFMTIKRKQFKASKNDFMICIKFNFIGIIGYFFPTLKLSKVVSTFFSLNSTVGGGVLSTMSTAALSYAGVIPQASPAVLKGAFLFGATTASVDYAATILSSHAKGIYLEDDPKRKVIDLMKNGFTIASQYAVAELGRRLFRVHIPTKFVHLSVASKLLEVATSSNKLSQACDGMVTVIYTRMLATFIKAPCSEHAFYAGTLNGSLNAYLGKVTHLTDTPVKAQIKDLRVLFIYRTTIYGIIAGLNLYLTGQAFKYLQIEAPKEYFLGLTTLKLMETVIAGWVIHLSQDIQPQLLEAGMITRLKGSQAPGVQEIYREIDEINKYADEPDPWSYPRIVGEVHHLLNRKTLAIPLQFIREWAQGTNREDLIVHSFEALGNQAEHLSQVIQAVGRKLGVEKNKNGTQFITDHVLKNASKSILEAFELAEADIIQLTSTKAVAMYVLDPEVFAEHPPLFFTAQTRRKIQELQHTFEVGLNKRDDYSEVLSQLTAVVSTETKEDFFSFKEGLSPEQQKALGKLREIGSREIQSSFIKVCAKNAAAEIAEKQAES